MKNISNEILSELRKKGFDRENYLSEIVDWFFENYNLFIKFDWEINELANRIDYCFEIDYVWGLGVHKEMEPIKKSYSSRTESQIQSILHAIELINPEEENPDVFKKTIEELTSSRDDFFYKTNDRFLDSRIFNCLKSFGDSNPNVTLGEFMNKIKSINIRNFGEKSKSEFLKFIQEMK